MKDYLERLTDNCSKYRFIYWWVFRGIMIYSFIACFFEETFDITRPLAMIANLACMFVWEVFMLFPKKSLFRHVPSALQSVLITLIFAAAFCGNYLNFYYDIRWWDSALHLIGGGLGVFFGYEFFCAMMKRDKKIASIALVVFSAFCFSFLVSTLWELFEFVTDEVSGLMSGMPTDAQHWNYLAAVGTPKQYTLFEPVVSERWPLMDTMGDMVLNTVGALVTYVIIRIYPYRHKGRFSFDFNK